jgi:hypothetical protein
MEYLIFKTLAFAITASFYIYWSFMRKGKDAKKENINPVELEDGNYALEKPADEFMVGVEYDSISETIKQKNNGNNNDLGDSSSGISSDPIGNVV